MNTSESTRNDAPTSHASQGYSAMSPTHSSHGHNTHYQRHQRNQQPYKAQRSSSFLLDSPQASSSPVSYLPNGNNDTSSQAMALADANSAISQYTARVLGSSSKYIVLLVEDDDGLVRKIRKFLREFGCEVDVANDGIGAWKRAEASTYDLILIDLVIPQLDGVTTVGYMRKSKVSCPIIAMSTTQTSQTAMNNYITQGITDVITKPFNRETLFSHLRRHLKSGEDEQNTSNNTQDTSENANTNEGRDLGSNSSQNQQASSEPNNQVNDSNSADSENLVSKFTSSPSIQMEIPANTSSLRSSNTTSSNPLSTNTSASGSTTIPTSTSATPATASFQNHGITNKSSFTSNNLPQPTQPSWSQQQLPPPLHLPIGHNAPVNPNSSTNLLPASPGSNIMNASSTSGGLYNTSTPPATIPSPQDTSRFRASSVSSITSGGGSAPPTVEPPYSLPVFQNSNASTSGSHQNSSYDTQYQQSNISQAHRYSNSSNKQSLRSLPSLSDNIDMRGQNQSSSRLMGINGVVNSDMVINSPSKKNDAIFKQEDKSQSDNDNENDNSLNSNNKPNNRDDYVNYDQNQNSSVNPGPYLPLPYLASASSSSNDSNLHNSNQQQQPMHPHVTLQPPTLTNFHSPHSENSPKDEPQPKKPRLMY